MYYGRVTYLDAVNMPVFLRRWWINKFNKTSEEEAKARNESQRLQQQHQTQSSRRR